MKMIVILVLSLAVVAHAGLKITVNGVVDPPDSTIIIAPSDWVTLGVSDDGQTEPGSHALGLTEGFGTFNASNMITFQGVTAGMTDDLMKAEALGIQNPFISMEVGNTQAGKLVDNLMFHCDGQGDVTLVLADWYTGEVYDTQVIHQIPEPCTLLLLGLGGLALRHRRP